MARTYAFGLLLFAMLSPVATALVRLACLVVNQPDWALPLGVPVGGLTMLGALLLAHRFWKSVSRPDEYTIFTRE
jgi:hypothetical protein